MKKVIALIILILISQEIFCQDTLRLTLEDVMRLAQEQSLEAYRAKNMYLVGYWNYRNYKAQLLPNVSLDLQPISYYRTITKRYDYNQNIDIFRPQQNLENSGGLIITQNLPLTGGKFYIRSYINRLYNMSEPIFVSYNVVPIQIGFYQPLFGYNDLKWQKRLAPLEFEIDKKRFVQNLERIKLQALDLYFNLLLQYKRMSIAEENLKNAEKLYEIGKEKFKILSIKKEDLLNLKLAKFNAEIDLKREKQALQEASIALSTYLNQPINTTIVPILPRINYNLSIDYNQALSYLQNNTNFLEDKQKILQADASLDKATKESRFQGNLVVNLGLNQQAKNLPDAYKNPLNQEIVSVNLQIPLLDWGRGKGQRQMAKMNRDIAEIDAKQNESKLQQQLLSYIMAFNLQKDIVKSAAKAKQIANESYKLTENSFIYGQTNVIDLNTTKTNRQQAEEKYIESIYTYWKLYYTIERMTLYDFIKNKEINGDDFFDKISNQ